MKNKKVELTKEEKIRKEIRERGKKQGIKIGQKLGIMQVGVRIEIWTHLMRGCIINYVH